MAGIAGIIPLGYFIQKYMPQLINYGLSGNVLKVISQVYNFFKTLFLNPNIATL